MIWKQRFSPRIRLHVLTYDRLALILLSVSLDTVQTAFDRHVLDFERVISLAECAKEVALRAKTQPPFVKELSLIRALLITAIRCRQLRLHLKGIDLLDALPKRTRTFEEKAVHVARAVVKIEEQGKMPGFSNDGLTHAIPKAS